MPAIATFNTDDYNVVEPVQGLFSSLPLVQLDPNNGKLFVNYKATEFLRSIPRDKKLGSISVVGPLRTGKSYLLSRMLNTSNGFEIGPTVEPCTNNFEFGFQQKFLSQKIQTNQQLFSWTLKALEM